MLLNQYATERFELGCLCRNPFLHALCVVDFGRKEISLRVDSDVMDPVKVSGIASGMPKASRHVAIGNICNMHFVVCPIDNQKKGLIVAWPEFHVPHRAGALARFFKDKLAKECSIFFENLESVVGAVANIDKAIFAKLYAVNRVGKLRRVWIV